LLLPVPLVSGSRLLRELPLGGPLDVERAAESRQLAHFEMILESLGISEAYSQFRQPSLGADPPLDDLVPTGLSS
jgi:hypothetical protein